MIDSLYATCSLTLDTLDAILQNIKINNIHRSKRILIKFLKMILKQKPLLKIEGKNQKETKDKYNKQTKKVFINLILPRDLKEPIPNYPYIYKWYRNDTNKIFYVGLYMHRYLIIYLEACI